MNRIIITFLFAIVLPVLSVNAQQKNNEADINAIRANFKKINGLPLKKEQFKYEAEGCVEEGSVQYFFQDKAIVKIIESGSIGDGSWTKEYYYDAGKFIFSYEKTIGAAANGQESDIEYRIYVKNGTAIRFMENQKIIPSDERVPKTLSIAGKLLTAYTTRKFAEILCNE